MSAWLLINEGSGQIEGRYFSSSQNAEPPSLLLELHTVFPVPHTHPALSDCDAWEAPALVVYGASWGRQLKRKPQTQIDRDATTNRR